MSHELYIIERRTPTGELDLKGDQPERLFGMGAIQGMTLDQIAKVVFRHRAKAVLDGRFSGTWAMMIDPAWKTRRKTW